MPDEPRTGIGTGTGLKPLGTRTDDTLVTIRDVRTPAARPMTDADPSETPSETSPGARRGVTLDGLAGTGICVAAAHLAFAALGIAAGGTGGYVAATVDGVAAVSIGLVAMLLATGRLPGWRRHTLSAAIPALVAAVTAVRVEALGSAWPASGFVLAALTLTWVRSARLFSAAGGASLAVATGSLLGHGITASGPDGRLSWAGIAVLTLTAGAISVVLRHAAVTQEVSLVAARRELAEQAVTDRLTGVANRHGLQLMAVPIIDQARRKGEAVHCLVVDIDMLNGTAAAGPGTPVGLQLSDELMHAVADAMRAATRSTDVVARWDGDTFVALGPGTGTSPLEMERRVRAHLASLPTLARQAWQGRISAGIATLVPWDGDDLDALLHRAAQDMALRRSLRRRAAAELHEDADRESTRTPDTNDR